MKYSEVVLGIWEPLTEVVLPRVTGKVTYPKHPIWPLGNFDQLGTFENEDRELQEILGQ